MKTYTRTVKDNKGISHTVSVEIDHMIPAVGGMVQTMNGLLPIAAVRFGVDWAWSDKTKTWTASPKMTRESTPRLVWYIKPEGHVRFDYSWRKGESR